MVVRFSIRFCHRNLVSDVDLFMHIDGVLRPGHADFAAEMESVLPRGQASA